MDLDSQALDRPNTVTVRKAKLSIYHEISVVSIEHTSWWTHTKMELMMFFLLVYSLYCFRSNLIKD